MSICTVDGRAVKSNQEMVLRLTWMRIEMRQKLFLELIPLDTTTDASSDSREFGPVRQPSGAMTDGKLKKSAMGHHPTDYIGKREYERPGGFSPVYVMWLGSPRWKEDMDELYWDRTA